MSRKWTMRKGGFEAAEFRITVTLSREDYDALKKAARSAGVPVRQYMVNRAEDGLVILTNEELF